jgi:phage terminase small subunit
MGRHAKHNWPRMFMEFCEGGFESIAEFARKYKMNETHVRNEFRKLNGSRSKIMRDVEAAKKSGKDRNYKVSKTDDTPDIVSNNSVSPTDTIQNLTQGTIQKKTPIEKNPKASIGGKQRDENGLTIREETFVLEYLIDFNSARAAIAAGYSQHTAASIGWELLRKPHIQQRLRQEAEADAIRLGINRDRILLEYARIAFGNVGDYVSFGQRQIPIEGTSAPSSEDGNDGAAPLTQTINYVDLNSSNQVDTSLISEISQGRDGVKVKLHDKMKALDKLERYLDVMPDTWKRKVEEERLGLERERLEIDRKKALGGGDEAETAHNERVTTLAELINHPEPDRHVEDFEEEDESGD